MSHLHSNFLPLLLLAAASLLGSPARAMPQGWDISDSMGVGVSFEHGPFRAVGAVSVEFTPSWYQDTAIKPGDRYLSLNGQLLPRGLADWYRVWSDAPPGEIVAVLLRDGAFARMWFHKHSERELRAMPVQQRQAMQRSPIDRGWLASSRAHVRWVRVGTAIPGTRAALAGLKPGDVVEAVGGDPNAQFSVEWALDRVAAHPEQETSVRVRRGSGVQRIRVPTADAHRKLLRKRSLSSVTVANTTPFCVQVLIVQEHLAPGSKLSPWHTVEPGESYQRTMMNPVGVTARPFYRMYARTVDEDRPLIEWLYRGGALPAGAEATLQWPNGGEQSLVSATRWIRDTSPSVSQSAPPADAYEVPLMDLHVDPARPRQHVAVLTLPPGLGFPGLASSADSPRALAATMVHAKLAAEAVRRQVATDRFLARYRHAPFHLGLEFDPDDDPTEIGVRITEAAATLPRGEAMGILPGDRLTSLGGRPVFNGRCALGIAREHGVNVASGGIDKPIAFVVRRPGQASPVRGLTSYWFVREFWENARGRESTASEAAFASGLDAVLFGFGDKVIGAVTSMRTGLTYQEAVWRARQSAEMARQWHSAAYASAEIGALFFSLPRMAIRKFAPRSIAREAGSTLGRVGYECLEQVVFSLRRGSPLRTSQQLQQELLWTLPLASAGAFVPGVLGRRLR